MNEYVTLIEFTLVTVLAALLLAVVVKNFVGTRSAYDVDAAVVAFASPAPAGNVNTPIARPTFNKGDSDSAKPFMFKISGPMSDDMDVENGLHLAGLSNSAFID